MNGNANTKFVVAKMKNAHNVIAVFIYIVSTSDSGRHEKYLYLYSEMINYVIMIKHSLCSRDPITGIKFWLGRPRYSQLSWTHVVTSV
jgi:hypothetical protein